MEQIISSILKRQGIDQIGVFDQEKDIWMYVKDEEVHFCTSDLAPIERGTLGFDQEIIFLTKTKESFYIVNDNDIFSNFIAIDKNNKIIVEAVYQNHDCIAQIRKVGENCFVISTKESFNSCNIKSENTPSLISLNFYSHFSQSYVFIGANYLKKYYLCSIFRDYYFFQKQFEYEIIVYKRDEGVVYKGIMPYIWIHTDGEAQLLISKNDYNFTDENQQSNEKRIESGIVKIWTLNRYNSQDTFRCIDYLSRKDDDYERPFLNEYYCEHMLFSNENIVFPFWGGFGAFIIQYEKKYDTACISAYTITFNKSFKNSRSCEYEYSFNDYILRIEETSEECDGFDEGEPICHDCHYHYLYDVYGNPIEADYNERRNYIVFSYPNKVLLSRHIQSTWGVMDTWKNEIIIPPICNTISVIDDENGLFEITYNNYVRGKKHQTKGLYSVENGFIIPSGIEYHIKDMIDKTASSNSPSKKYVVYTSGKKKGIIYNGRKFINAEYEYISNGYYYNNHGYFIVKIEGKVGVISDDSSFSNQSSIEYDSVLFSSIIGNNCYFVVEKDGKFGAVCTNEAFTIPLVFDDIDKIVNSGVICNGVLYDRNGKELFVFGENYKHIKTKYYDVFESIDSNDYVFIDSRGKKINSQRDEDNENIIHVGDINGIHEYFDVEKRDFVEDDNDNSYYDSSYTQDELDDMCRAAFEEDPEAEWNID